MTVKHEYNIFGVVTRKTTADWLFSHPDAIGVTWMERGAQQTLIGGVDKLVDNSKVILEWGSTGYMEVDLAYTVYVSKAYYEAVESKPVAKTNVPQFGSIARVKFDERELFDRVQKAITELELALGTAAEFSDVMTGTYASTLQALHDMIHDECCTESMLESLIEEVR